jgi:plasmid maintenance system antidote protein VapI
MVPRIPHPLLDALIDAYSLKNDKALARALDVLPADISRIRNQRRPIRAEFILRVHEATDWPIKRIKELGA